MFCSLKSISFVVSLARASYVIVSAHRGKDGTGRIACIHTAFSSSIDSKGDEQNNPTSYSRVPRKINKGAV